MAQFLPLPPDQQSLAVSAAWVNFIEPLPVKAEEHQTLTQCTGTRSYVLTQHVVPQPLSTSSAVDMFSLLLCERLGDALATLLQGIRDARQKELQVCTEVFTAVEQRKSTCRQI